MKNESLTEQQDAKQAYSQPVLVDLGDLKSQTMGTVVGTGGDAASDV